MVAFKRRLDEKTVKRAAAIVTVYMSVFIMAALILAAVDSFSLKEALFNAASALGSVGLSMGMIPSLSVIGKSVIIVLMFAGRIGWITLLIALAKKRIDPAAERPTEKILIG
jgi:trk system potassium uptake protein TrkH